MATPNLLALTVLATLRHNFSSYKTLTDRALAQLSAEEWLVVPAPGANSVAVIIQHMCGNLRSRFTDFLTADGEKPDRQRDQEFAQPATVAEVAALQQRWHATWPILFELLDTLAPTDLLRTVQIRGEAHTVLAALERQATHYAYHSGQIVLLAKHLRGEAWQSLSIPRGQSEQFNQQMRARLNPTAGSGV
ncbi:DUF1572 domain-containing protein [Hymenobacter sp. BT635]|uniref:DUF1572 domain-containing protein n=1 Tax=Hymenobacter nitidus TaxID=2880929 RepID=A0ABS8AC81_9BACT|nr:DUF1572 family protein [Hymenobacter nitidus]MCB2377481.1 DUF1572 domain-containing protein [Hymenobacter nitidus]